MENKQKVGEGWCKASFVFGVLTMVFALLPLLSAWLMFLTAFNYLLAPIGVICGVVAIIKSQNLVKSIIGLVLCILALCMPLILAEDYLESSIDSVGNMLELFDSF